RVKVPLAFETEPMILPTRRATLSASASLINTRMPNRTIEIGVSDLAPGNAQIALDLPEGWRAERNDHGFTVSAPTNLADGRYSIAASLDGQPAMSVSPIDHTHVGPTARCHRAEVTIGAWGVAIPDGKVGYIGSGNDRVGDWLREMGADVVAISDAEIDSDSALAEFDAIVIGIFAVRFRSGLLDAMPRLHRWTEAGGTLLTLYHRPWDNWDPNTVPPRRLEIGQPSLRWRVTDERADVTQIAEHPILSTPNPIGETEWLGWVKERGLYFAMRWDPAYRALLSMSDPGEEPHEGALLVADIGKGRHVHCALILHHQMEHLVPGAFRLLANFIAPRE
ncbi:MAG: PIG-L family deacetylase, partial [Pseudomonadota bacterium]